MVQCRPYPIRETRERRKPQVFRTICANKPLRCLMRFCTPKRRSHWCSGWISEPRRPMRTSMPGWPIIFLPVVAWSICSGRWPTTWRPGRSHPIQWGAESGEIITAPRLKLSTGKEVMTRYGSVLLGWLLVVSLLRPARRRQVSLQRAAGSGHLQAAPHLLP
jgi:hypothetical protein